MISSGVMIALVNEKAARPSPRETSIHIDFLMSSTVSSVGYAISVLEEHCLWSSVKWYGFLEVTDTGYAT